MIRKVFLLTILLVFKERLFSQIESPSGVKIDRLAKTLDGKFHHSDSLSSFYTGVAYELYQNKRINFYWQIINGVTVKFLRFSELGRAIVEENFNTNGNYTGLYLQGNEVGDTLTYGHYNDGKKIGQWITTDVSGKKIIRQY